MSSRDSKEELKGNSRGTACATFVGAVLVSLVLAYFLLPLLSPTTVPKGLVSQTQIVESRSSAGILSPQTTLAIIPDMTIEITIADKSSLQAMLSSEVEVFLGEDEPGEYFSGTAIFELSIVVQGVGNRTGSIQYYSSAEVNSTIRYTQTFYLEFRTGSLSAGKYNVTAYWLSPNVLSHTGMCQLSLNRGTAQNFNYTRTLTVQEITG